MQAYRRSFVIAALFISLAARLAAAPTINTQPINASIIMGQSATFSVTATVNTGSLSYLWSASTDGGTTWSPLSNNEPSNNVTTATLQINAPAYALNGAQVRCAVTDSSGTITTNPATLTLTSPAPFLILANPSSTTAFQGDTVTPATFTVVATPTGANAAPTYQWQVSTNGGTTLTDVTDGATYAGSTTATLSITDPFANLSGGSTNNGGIGYKYLCNVTSGAYTIPTKGASLNIFPTPTFTAAVTINGTASPTSVATNSTSPITVQVSGINLGDTIRIDRYSDRNGNGVIDPGEALVQSFTVTDGLVTSFGGVTDPAIPGDTDGSANGTVTAAFTLGNTSEFSRTAGAFIFRVVSLSGTFRPANSAVFSLTQPSQAQSISGTVINTATSLPVPYAGVGLLDNNSNNGNFVSGVVADINGVFTIQAPPGSYSLFPAAAGYVGGMTNLPALTSSVSLTGQTVNVTPAAYMQVLKLKDQSNGNPLRGVQIFFQSKLTNVVAIADTDNNGVATAGAVATVGAVAASDWSYDLSSQNIMGLGYLRPSNNNGKSQLYTTNGSISLQAANAMIYGTLTDNTTPTPVPLANVDIQAGDQNNNYSADMNTDASGHYYLPVYGTNGQWYVNVDNSNPIFGTTYSLPQSQSVNPVNASTAYPLNFVAPVVTAHLSGIVTNADTASVLSGVYIDLYSVSGPNTNFVTSVQTGLDGSFSFGVTAGSWQIALDNSSNGNGPSFYVNSNNLVAPVLSYPTVMDFVDVTGIAYAVKNGTFTISGSIKDFVPVGLSNANVNASATIGGVNYMASYQTDNSGSGSYSLPVINGSWTMNVYSNNGLFFPQRTLPISGASSPNQNFFATVFTSNPGTHTITAGQNTSFFVNTQAPSSPTLQWLVSTDGGTIFNPVTNSAIYSGATTNNLGISSATLGMTGYKYRLSATFFYNSVQYTRTSNIGTLTVNSVSPFYNTNPTNQTTTAGSGTAFSVSVGGAPTPTIQWQVSADSGGTWNNLSDGGYYSGTATNTLVVTNADFSINNYRYRTVATNTGGSLNSLSATLTVNRTSQTVNFSGSTVSINSPVTLSPFATSGLTSFTYFSTGSTTTFTLNSGVLTITGVGSVTVQANQAGNNFYAPASNTATFTVSQQPVTVSFGNLSQTYDGSPKSVSVTTSPPGVSNSVSYTQAAIPVTPISPGNYDVAVTITDSNYFLSGSGTATLTIAQANQSINFASLADQTYRTTPIPLNASSTSGLGVTFNVQGGPATVSGNQLTLTGLGVVTVRASQSGNTNYNAAPVQDRSFNVTKGAATVALGNLSAAYDGSPKSASATTNPNSLIVNLTYNGTGTAPTNAGTYAVVGTINDTLYQGTAKNFLVIAPPPGPGVEALDAGFTRPQFRRLSLPGRITADQVTGSGKIYAAFDNGNTVTGVNNQRIGAVVRLNSNGSTDSSFNIGSYLTDAWAVVPLANGQVLVGGVASNENPESGVPNFRVFRFNNDGSPDYSYVSPVFAAMPRFMTLQPDGRLLVAPSIGSNSPNGGLSNLVRLNQDGSVDGTFHIPSLDNPNGIFANIVLDATGNIYIGGTFGLVNGTPRLDVARLNPDGTLDITFIPSGFSPGGGIQVRGLGLQTQGANAGKLLVAGKPLLVATFNRTIIRLNTDGSLDGGFTLLNVGQVEGPNGVRPRMLNMLPNDQFQIITDSVTRFNSDGSLVGSGTYARPVLSKEAFWMDSLADGTALVPAEFASTAAGTPVSGPIRFTPGGALDGTFAPGPFQTEVYPSNFAIQPDGRTLVWGNFDTVNTTPRAGMARINTDGSLDTFSLSGVANLYSIQDAKLLTNGQILAATLLGTYQNSNTTVLNGGVSRFNSNGTVDSSFTLDPAANPGGLHALDDGTLLTWNLDPVALLNGGLFFKRLGVTGAIDNSFTGLGSTAFGAVYRNAGSPFAITQIVQGSFEIVGHYPDGRTLAIATVPGGANYPQNAASLNFTVLRLNADGTIDSTFTAPVVAVSTSSGFTDLILDPMNTGPGPQQQALVSVNGSPFSGEVAQSDGSVLVYGSFTNLGGNPAPGIARLTNTGAFDASFNSSIGTGAQLLGQPGRTAQVEHIDIAPNGQYWVTGMFDTFAGVAAPGIVRLNADGTVDTTLATTASFRPYLGNGTKTGFGPSGEVVLAGTFGPANEPFPFGLTRLVGTVAPAITTQPLSQTVPAGTNVTFSVGVTPGLTVAYQWFRNAVAITGATNSTLTLTNVQAGDAASYTVAVTNAVTFATSNAAVLTLGSTFNSWQSSKFTSDELGNINISGPNAVYGQDGLSNLVKYALGLEPKQNITTALPGTGVSGSNWTYTYTRPTNISDVTYAVQYSTDLVSWTSLGAGTQLSSISGTDTWQATYPLASAAKIFFRLNVTQP